MPFSAFAVDSYPWLAAMISPFGALMEPELPGVILADLKLGGHRSSPSGSGLSANRLATRSIGKAPRRSSRRCSWRVLVVWVFPANTLVYAAKG